MYSVDDTVVEETLAPVKLPPVYAVDDTVVEETLVPVKVPPVNAGEFDVLLAHAERNKSA